MGEFAHVELYIYTDISYLKNLNKISFSQFCIVSIILISTPLDSQAPKLLESKRSGKTKNQRLLSKNSVQNQKGHKRLSKAAKRCKRRNSPQN